MNTSCAIVIPVFNNEKSISSVVDEVLHYSNSVIVVDDGSTDSTLAALTGRDDITLLTHKENRGKGAALRTGFEHAYENGFSHVITIDGDGEHNTGEIPKWERCINEDPESIWIGKRDGSKERLFTANFSNLWLKLFTGYKINDTLCGYRLYPLKNLAPLDIKSQRFDYEQEVLFEASLVGIALKEIPIQDVAVSDEVCQSHFHPVKDMLRIARVHFRVVIHHINPFTSLQVEGDSAGEKIRNLLKQELTSHTTPLKASLALSLGVFMGIFPIHGFQVVTLMFLATKFKLNRPIAYLGVNISAPPLIPLLIIAAVKVGDLFLPGMIDVYTVNSDMIKKGSVGFLAFLLGSVIIAPLAALVTFILSYPFFKSITGKRS